MLNGEVRSFDMLKNIKRFKEMKVINDVEISYIEGLFVEIELASKELVEEFLGKAHSTWMNWFTKLSVWQP